MAKKLKKPVSILLSLIMVFSMFAIVPLSASAADEGEYPAAFDLRDRGVVTPVKFQNPYGSCWSFAGIAAAESSILTTLGMTAEEYKGKTGHDFDLSEKHLAWYGALPVTENTNASQAGEGLYVIGENKDNFHYDAGGEGIMITTLFSAGVGPVNEDAFPYQGKEGLTHDDVIKNNPELAKKYLRAKAEKSIKMSLDNAVDELKTSPDKANEWFKELYDKGYLTTPGDQLTVDMIIEAYYQKELDYVNSKNYTWYSPADDWTIPELDADGDTNRDVYSGYTLLHGNQLPDLSIKDENGNWAGINPDGMSAVKSELSQGRAVAVQFCADDALPDQEASEKGYMNVKTWAHYTYEDVPYTHGVCIVGWDDDYSKENFAEGNQPPGDGAWIVKNSWGSETEPKKTADGKVIGGKDWGIVNDEGKHTGYFYLSYYDKSVTGAETMEFDVDLSQAGGDMSCWSYDYMPNRLSFMKSQDTEVIKTANVFPNNSGKAQSLYAVSTRTSYPNATVKYSVYLLGENAETPDEGELLCTKTATYTYMGFHREKLDGSITVKDGEKIAVVAEETVDDGNGGVLYDFGPNNMRTETGAKMVGEEMYGVGIVNEGESFVYRDGKWTDLTNYKIPGSDEIAEMAGMPFSDVVATDNFSIKAYMVAKGEEPSAAIYGDVDGDGEVTINDATYIQKYLAKYDMPDTFRLYLADVNADNRVSILDVTCIQKYLAKYAAGYGRTGQPYEDPVLTYCSKSAIDHLGYDNMAMIYNLISDDILPQVVSQLTAAIPTFTETDGGKAIGEKIGLLVYTSEFPDSVAASREALAYVSGFPIGTENYVCMLGVNVLTLFEKDPKTGTYTFKESERANLENTVIHEMMHAFMNDYVRAGNTTDKTNNYPGWFCEGIASAVENVYTFRYDQYSKIYGYSRGNGESAEVSTDDLLEFYKEYSEVYPVEGGPTHVPDIGTSDDDGNRISAYTMGYLATLYLSYLAQADNPTDYSSFSAGEFRTGLNKIFSLLHSGHSLDEVISSISGGMYKNTDDFTAKFVKGENGDGTNGKEESVTAEVSLGFCVSYLNYLGEVTTQLQKTDSNATANGSILLPLDTAEKSPIKAQAPEGAKENQQYFNIYRDPNIEQEDQPYVYSTVDPAIAYQSGGKTYTIPLN